MITTNSTVKIEPVYTYLNPDIQKLAIPDNKNKAGYIDELIHLTKILM